MTNIEPKLELLADCTNDMPEMVIVCATPGVSRVIFSIWAMALLGALERGRVGQLDVDDEPALVLLGDEAGRGDRERSSRSGRAGRRRPAATSRLPRSSLPTAQAYAGRRRRRRAALNSRKNQPSSRSSSQVERVAARPARLAAGWPPGAGLSVSELIAEKTVETAIVTANWRKNWPVIPLMNAHGTNTAQSTSATAMTGPVTSSIALRVASRGGSPCSSQRSTFSTTTIASSTTMPIASTSPNSEMLFRLKPSAAMTAKVPTIATGTATSGISTARQFCRKTSTTIADQDDGLEQGPDHLRDRLADERRGVVGDGVVDAFGESAS